MNTLINHDNEISNYKQRFCLKKTNRLRDNCARAPVLCGFIAAI